MPDSITGSLGSQAAPRPSPIKNTPPHALPRLSLRSLWTRFCAVRERSGFQSGWGLIGWGIAAFLGTPDYAGLTRYASPVVWAVIPALLGGVQLAVVFAGPTRWQRRLATLIAGVWLGLWVFLLSSHAHVVMLAIVPTFIMANALSSVLPPAKRGEGATLENSPTPIPNTTASNNAAPNNATPPRGLAGDKDYATASP